MLRRLLSVLALTLPLLVTALVAPAPASAALVETAVYVKGESLIARYGEPDSVTAFVIAEQGVAVGTVSVKIDGQPIGSGTLTPSPATPAPFQAQAEVALPLLQPGDHQITLSYLGNTRFAPSSFSETLHVSKADPTLSLVASPTQASPGQPVTLTAKVGFTPGAAAPTGTVTFRHSDKVLAVRPVGPAGTATLSTSGFPAGRQSLSVSYSGDVRYDSALTDVYYEVRRVTTTTGLSVTPSPATYGDRLRIAATVRAGVATRGAPSEGSVTFRIDGREVATVPVAPIAGSSDGVSSVAVLDKADLDAGTHRIEALYSGGGTFAASNSTNLQHVVARRTTTLTAAPALLGANPFALPGAVLRATLVGNNGPVTGGLVTFTAGTTVLCTATTDAQGVATCDSAGQLLTLLLNGGYYATYAGDANNTASKALGGLIG